MREPRTGHKDLNKYCHRQGSVALTLGFARLHGVHMTSHLLLFGAFLQVPKVNSATGLQLVLVEITTAALRMTL